MDEQDLIISALLKALHEEWPEGTAVPDMVRHANGVTAEELLAIESHFL